MPRVSNTCIFGFCEVFKSWSLFLCVTKPKPKNPNPKWPPLAHYKTLKCRKSQGNKNPSVAANHLLHLFTSFALWDKHSATLRRRRRRSPSHFNHHREACKELQAVPPLVSTKEDSRRRGATRVDKIEEQHLGLSAPLAFGLILHSTTTTHVHQPKVIL